MKCKFSRIFMSSQFLLAFGEKSNITLIQIVMLLPELCYPMKKKVQLLC